MPYLTDISLYQIELIGEQESFENKRMFKHSNLLSQD